jgi:hypothetical protein
VPTGEEKVSEQYELPSAKGRTWFLAALLVMVILAVAAGLTLSRIRDAEAGTGADPSTSATVSLELFGDR